MRDWLAAALSPPQLRIAETAQTAETPPGKPLRLVSAVSAVSALAQEVEERAAIVEFDGGVPRVLAECLARLEVCPALPGVDPERWQAARGSFVMLVASGAAEQALVAGWALEELCGIPVIAPHDRPNLAGLIFSLEPHDRVGNVSAIGCEIRFPGGRHIWRRCPLPSDNSIRLPWELGT